MYSKAHQHTLDRPAICAGIGVHSGERARLTLKPASPGTGIVFNRTDVEPGTGTIPCRGDLVYDVALGTKLKNTHGVTLSTVEHLVATLYGLGIDNALIDIDGPEVPIMDGSSAQFVELIRASGIRQQSAPRKYLRILEPINVLDGVKSAALLPVDDDSFTLDATIDFETRAIGRQRKELKLSEGAFERELAFARTFGMKAELDQLHKMGLGRGASLENAVAVENDEILNPEGLRVKDEFVRHKMLDAVGDLALTGFPLIGRYEAEQPGHSINNLLVRELLINEDKWIIESLERMPAHENDRVAPSMAFSG